MRYGVTKESKEVCDELGVKVLAYSPLGRESFPENMFRMMQLKCRNPGKVPGEGTIASYDASRKPFPSVKPWNEFLPHEKGPVHKLLTTGPWSRVPFLLQVHEM
jgi:hypothetical protein